MPARSGDAGELGFVGHITSVGIRSARRIPYEEAIRDGSLIISGTQFRELGPEAVAELIPPAENLYITFDVDVLDPSQAPGTGTPESGGLFYQESRDCLLALLKRSNLVAFDIVEVAPPYDSSELTVQVAARLMQDILAARFPSGRRDRLSWMAARVPDFRPTWRESCRFGVCGREENGTSGAGRPVHLLSPAISCSRWAAGML